MKKIIGIIMIMAVCISISAQSRVIQLPADSGMLPKTNGFFYRLPKTAFKVDVTISRTNLIKGYYTDYAEKLLGLSNVIQNNETSYALKNVAISPVTIPDSTHLFYVELSPRQIKKQFLSQLYQNTTPYSNQIFTSSFNITSTQLPDFFKNYSAITYVEKEDHYVETQIIEGVVTEVPVSKTKMVTKSVEQKAQEAADFIIQIRKDKYDLTAGVQEVPYSKEALALMIAELNQWETNYLDLFTGISIEDELSYTFIVIPEDEDDTLIPLFSIDPQNGLLQGDAAQLEHAYFLKIDPQLSYDKWTQLLSEKAKEEKYNPNNGYSFRKAAPALLSLVHHRKEIQIWGIYNIFQLGIIETLPAKTDEFDISKFVYIY